MTYLEKLRARLKEKAAAKTAKGAEIDALVKKDDLTADEVKSLKTLTGEANDLVGEADALQDEIKTLEDAEKAKGAYAVPAAAKIEEREKTPARPSTGEFKSADEKIGVLIFGMMKAFREQGLKGSRATFAALDEMGFGSIAAEFDQKSLNAGTGSAGGILIPDNFDTEVVKMLTPFTAFLRGGPANIPLAGGNYRQAAEASRPTASYRAEGGAIAQSQPTFRDFSMTSKLLSGLVPLTNQIIRWSAGRASTMARNSLATVMGLTMDQAAFLGTGLGNVPLGIFRLPGITTFGATNSATPTVPQIDGDARKLINVAAQFPELQVGLAWVMTQRVKGYLEDLRDGNGNIIYPTLGGASPTWKGYPVLLTGSIPNNGGAGTNESTIGLVSFGTTLFGEGKGLELAISEEATINGVNMFETDQTAIRATMEHDFNARYAESVGTLTAVKWGS